MKDVNMSFASSVVFSYNWSHVDLSEAFRFPNGEDQKWHLYPICLVEGVHHEAISQGVQRVKLADVCSTCCYRAGKQQQISSNRRFLSG